ncbi:MAG: site-2 protease family protein, partial [Chitinophagaceae bacterium]|nr:site-2 protease family protein [Chitinophagaceae bacterium]
MTLLAIEWGVVGIKAAQLVLALSILVILHEFGHYITARWFGCRVEKFYLFFDPWFSLFKKKVGDTEYGVGWLPLGGYVKISGMIDESMDTEAMKQPAQDWEFRSKPAWQRLIIMLGGIIVNVILAVVIYAMVLAVWGQTKIPLNSLKYGVSFQDSIYQQLGFQQGDRILSVDGKPVTYLDDATLRIFMAKSAQVERNGQQV